nr:DUF2199 domain-containing protein [Conchiformibius kuhniae]
MVPALVFAQPDPYRWLGDAEKTSFQAECDRNTCRIAYPQQTECFIRTVLVLPVQGHDVTLEYGAWLSVSEQNYHDYREHFNDNDHCAAYVGYLANALPDYLQTYDVIAKAHTQGGGLRPLLELKPDPDHPLVRDFYHGISFAEAQRRVDKILGARR